MKMMAKKPDRYQTAEEVADVLSGWLTAHYYKVDAGGSGSSARPPISKREVLPGRDNETQHIRRVEKGPGIRRSSGSNSDILRARGVPTARPIVEPAAIPITQGDTFAISTQPR